MQSPRAQFFVNTHGFSVAPMVGLDFTNDFQAYPKHFLIIEISFLFFHNFEKFSDFFIDVFATPFYF